MKTEYLSYDAAIAVAKQLPFAWITEFSRVYYGSTPETLNPDEWIEAHFFGSSQELRFTDGAKDATLLTQDNNDLYIDETVNLTSAVTKGDSVTDRRVLIRKIIRTDKDGQAYIDAVRLVTEEDA